MNAEQRAALRKLAEEATQGPWNVYDKARGDGFTKYFGVDSEKKETVVLWDEFGGIMYSADASYIAAANPQAIRELLDYIDQLEAKIDDLVMSLDAARGE